MLDVLLRSWLIQHNPSDIKAVFANRINVNYGPIGAFLHLTAGPVLANRPKLQAFGQGINIATGGIT